MEPHNPLIERVSLDDPWQSGQVLSNSGMERTGSGSLVGAPGPPSGGGWSNVAIVHHARSAATERQTTSLFGVDAWSVPPWPLRQCVMTSDLLSRRI